MNVLGLDIGGVNTKMAVVQLNSNTDPITILDVKSKYLPFWLEKEKLEKILVEIKELTKNQGIDVVGVTMTAELSDCFRTKREGITWVAQNVSNIFPEAYFLNLSGKINRIEEVLKTPEAFDASNWLATALFIGKKYPMSLLIDVGSTTTDIILIHKGKPISKGITDLERLCSGELVYTGALRTNVACIVSEMPIRGKIATVASELFSTSGDVHLILGNINSSEFTCETADRRLPTVEFAMERLARVLCADLEEISCEEIKAIAKFVYQKQIEQIETGISQVAAHLDRNYPVVVTGLGSKFLATPGAKNQGFTQIIDLSNTVGFDASIASSAVATAAIVGQEVMYSA